MHYLIDGHNLIPKIPGFSLREIDDETRLIELLQEYCRRSRKQVEVFFDNSPPGQPRVRTFGNVTARFVRAGESADQAITQKLSRLGNAARNWTVVSSDREVQSAARAVRARLLSSEAFADLLRETLSDKQSLSETENPPPKAEEVQEWLDLFKGGRRHP